MNIRRALALTLAVLLGSGLLAVSPAAAQTVSVDGGFISIWQDLTNYTTETDRIPKDYRVPVCRVLPADEMLQGLREFGYTACPTPLAAPSVRGAFTLILHDLATNDLNSDGTVSVQFVVERADETEQELARFLGQQGHASGQLPWAPMALERGDLIVARVRVQGAAIRRLEREGAILLVSLGR